MTSIYGQVGKNNFRLRLDYEVTQQSTTGNYSRVRMVLYLYANTTGSYNQDGDAYWGICGARTNYKFSYTSAAWYKLGERTTDIPHDADGTKTTTLTGEWCSAISGGWAPYSLSVSGNVTLPAIPRATVPVMGAATIGERVSISLPRASGGFTHTLTYQFGSATEIIAQGAGTAVEWAVPESLADQIPNAASGKGTVTCKTYNGSALIGSKDISFTATVPGTMKPIVETGWATVTYDNSGTKAGDIAAWVQGYSKARAVFDGSKIVCKHGATVKGYSITYLGKTAQESPYRTETIGTTSATVRCTVTDSRGLTAWEDFPIELQEYAPPVLVGAQLYRSDGEGIAADNGTHIAGRATARISALGGLNSVRMRGYWKGMSGSYGSGVSMTSGTVGLVTGNVEISADRSYVAKLTVTDALGNTAEFEENIPTEKVAFHLREGGLGAAFGKAAEEDHVLELAEDWDLKIGGKSLFDMIYPVGSVYISFSDANPTVLFGGTWERINNCFLWACDEKEAIGQTGGEATHTLTLEEMPSHQHIFARGFNDDNIPDYLGGSTATYGVREGMRDETSTQNYYTNKVGGGAAHNNMPPYIQVAMWRRTA